MTSTQVRAEMNSRTALAGHGESHMADEAAMRRTAVNKAPHVFGNDTADADIW